MLESEIPEDFGRHMLETLRILEKSWGIKLSQNHKLLLAEVGSLEQLLSIIADCPIHVEIEKNVETAGVYTREVYLCDDTRRLIRAVSHYSLTHIPQGVLRDIQKTGIGSALMKHNIDTRRRITRLGYDEGANRVYRIYEIIHNNDVWFTIEESFNLDDVK